MAFTLKYIDVKMGKSSPHGQDRTYKLEYQVTSDAATTLGAAADYLVSNLPSTLTSYGDANAKLEDFSCNALEEGSVLLKFGGTANYEKKRSSQSNEDENSSDEVQIRFGQNSYEKVKYSSFDANKKKVAVLNSAGARFGEPLLQVEKRLQITVSKTYNKSVINPASFQRYFDSVNLNAIRIADIPIIQRGGHMKSISPVAQRITGDDYDWRITYEIEVRGNGETYDREVLDQGFYFLEEVNGYENAAAIKANPNGFVLRLKKDGGSTGVSYYRKVHAKVLNEDGEEETSKEPVLLDGKGGLLFDTTPGNEKYIVYRSHPEKNWSVLDLPKTVAEGL